MDGYGGIEVESPNRFAMSITLCSPRSIPRRMVGRFRDR
jgi:hypothetical protein